MIGTAIVLLVLWWVLRHITAEFKDNVAVLLRQPQPFGYKVCATLTILTFFTAVALLVIAAIRYLP